VPTKAVWADTPRVQEPLRGEACPRYARLTLIIALMSGYKFRRKIINPNGLSMQTLNGCS
jgi:hypothetical protein